MSSFSCDSYRNALLSNPRENPDNAFMQISSLVFVAPLLVNKKVIAPKNIIVGPSSCWGLMNDDVYCRIYWFLSWERRS